MTGLIFAVGVGFLVALVVGQRAFDRSFAPWVIALVGGEALSFLYSWRLYRRAIPRIERATAAGDWNSAPQVI